jgi:hypothetical protein
MMLSLTRNGQPWCAGREPSGPTVPVTGSAFNDTDLRAIISGVRLQLLCWSKLLRLAPLRMTLAQSRFEMIVEDGCDE